MKRSLLALFVLLLLAGVGALVWMSDTTSIGHRVTYSDGTTLTLKKVTYGTEHRYRGSGLWQRMISLLPRQYALKFASRRNVLTTARPSVAFWFERRGKVPAACDLVLCDTSGYGVSGDYVMMRLSPPDELMEGWAFEFWPRRGRTFTLRVYEPVRQRGEATLIGEFTVRNPTPGNYPVWAAQPLPLTAHVEDLSVTLLDLVAGVGPGSYNTQPASNPLRAMTRADFRVERDGRTTKEWGIASVESSDATGNWISRHWGTGQDEDRQIAELQPHPWPSEPAWKLRAGFSQRSNFVASELWTVRGVPLSEPDSVQGTALQTNLQGARLEYTGLARRPGLGGSHHFNFRVSPYRPDFCLTLAQAVDDQGREAKVGDWWQGLRECAFSVDAEPGAQRLDLTVALHRTRYVEFLTRPRLISTNGLAPP